MNGENNNDKNIYISGGKSKLKGICIYSKEKSLRCGEEIKKRSFI